MLTLHYSLWMTTKISEISQDAKFQISLWISAIIYKISESEGSLVRIGLLIVSHTIILYGFSNHILSIDAWINKRQSMG